MAREEKLELVCYEWILDFHCRELWYAFRDGPSDANLRQTSLESITQGLMKQITERGYPDQRKKEICFATMLSLLTTLREDSNRSSIQEQEDEAELFSEFLSMIEDLTVFCRSHKTIVAKAKQVQLLTNLEKLYALCRLEKYDEAQQLFDELVDVLDKDTRRKVEAVLKSKKKSRFLNEDTKTDYIATMKDFLEEVFNAAFSSKPVLIQFADKCIGSGSKHSGVKHSVYLPRDIDAIVSEKNDVDEDALAEKLRKIRHKKQKLISRTVNASANNNSADDYDDADLLPELDSDTSVRHKSSSPKKCSTPRKDHSIPRKVHQPRGEQSRRSRASSESEGSSVEVSDDEADTDRSLNERVPLKSLHHFHKRHSLAPRPHKSRHAGRIKWTMRETEDFYKAVQKYGVGGWAEIRDDLKTFRTNVQLKDKWRCILNTEYDRLCKRFGPVDDN